MVCFINRSSYLSSDGACRLGVLSIISDVGVVNEVLS